MRIVRLSSTVNSTPNTSSEKRRAPSRPLASISFANNGTKAALKAPSANSLRNVFGKRKAALKASAIGPVPNAAAISISRVKPKTRLISVPDATVANFLTRLILLCRHEKVLPLRLCCCYVAFTEECEQFLPDAVLSRRVGNLMANEIGDIEHVDNLLTKCSHMG